MEKQLTIDEVRRVQLLLDTKLYNQLINYVMREKEAGNRSASNSDIARKAIRQFLKESDIKK